MLKKFAFVGTTLVLALAPAGLAQNTPVPATAAGTVGDPTLPMRGATIAFRSELMDTAPIKGVPFCGTVVSEHTQTFADGNRIHTSENSMLCRDSEGRTRRESQLNLLGAVPQGTQAPKFITILDPVAGVRYVLDTANKIARKSPLSGPPITAAGVPSKAGQNVMIYNRTFGPAGPAVLPGETVMVQKRVVRGEEPPADRENLGDQMINGIHATGNRITTTIPAGKMGNEKPMNVVSEDWYSPELKTMVKTVHSDPWAGELTTQLTNLNTSEPDPSLFTVPSDYRVVENSSEKFMLKVPPQPPE